MINTEKKLLQANNQKLTHAGAKILFLKMKVCVPTLEHGNEEKFDVQKNFVANLFVGGRVWRIINSYGSRQTS